MNSSIRIRTRGYHSFSCYTLTISASAELNVYFHEYIHDTTTGTYVLIDTSHGYKNVPFDILINPDHYYRFVFKTDVITDTENVVFIGSYIAQTTGESTHVPMSQKAVTEANPRSLQYARLIPKTTRHVLEFNVDHHIITIKPCYILNGNQRYDIEEQTLNYNNIETINVIVFNPDNGGFRAIGKAAVENVDEWIIAVYNSNTIGSTSVVVCDCPYKIGGIEYMPFNSGLLPKVQMKLKVCSYNVGLYNNGVYVAGNTYDDYESIVSAYRQFLNDGAFDLVGLQEGTDIKDSINIDVYDRQLPNHVYDGNTHTNIRTVYPIISQETGMLTDGSRGYSSAIISVNGKEVFVMSVHFGLDGDIQSANAAQVLEMLEGHEYAVVFGDFNAGNGDVTAETLFANFTNAGYKLALGDYLPFKSTVRNSEVMFYEGNNEIISADTFVGNLTGVAARAVSDKNGNDITSTYATKNEVTEAYDLANDAKAAADGKVSKNGDTINGKLQVNGDVTANNFTGNLNGTATNASNVIDSGNGQQITLNYSASAVSSPTYLAAWNGYELRGASREDLKVGSAENADHATSAVNDGNGKSIADTYLPKSGGEMTGVLAAKGGLLVSGRVKGSGDDEGIVVERASSGYATLCLGDTSGIRSALYLSSSNEGIWRLASDGVHAYDIKHPGKNGTVALVSDIDDKIASAITTALDASY